MFKIKKDIYKKIYKIIKAYKKIVIARHVGPDPDAIGSQIALRDAIKLTFPDKEVYAVGAGVAKFRYLGALDKVDNFDLLEGALLIVLDLPNFQRLDGVDELSYNQILKIDHHPAEDIIGTVDWTDESKSSTCEMITNFLMNSKMVMDTKIAETLFVGMVFDSDRFLLKNTSVATFETVTELLKKYQFNFVASYDNLYERSLAELKFYAYLIANINISENSFGSIEIEKETLKKYDVDSSTPSNMVNDFYFIKELVCWCFITFDERNGVYKVNIRSRGPVINEIAAKYNGGGHKYASGCRIKNKSDIAKLFKELDKACELYKSAETK